MRMLLLLAGSAIAAAPANAAWFKGNTHTHTTNSDGDSSPQEVTRWYRERGYDFLVITDHEFVTDVEPLNAEFGGGGKFLVMRGQEVTQRLADPRRPCAHLNAINSTRVVEPIGAPHRVGRTAPFGMGAAATLLRNIAEVRAAGGLPQVNHPNFNWALRPEDLFELPDHILLEIFNGHPLVNNLGGVHDDGSRSPSAEGFWDAALTRGRVVWGVASDDSHHFGRYDERGFAHPGKGWVVVDSDKLTPEAITAALAGGRFYSSTGVEVEKITASRAELSLVLKPARDDRQRYGTRFVGAGGRVLAEADGSQPRYAIKGDEGYVRAVVTDSNGWKAWTQPVFLDGRETARR